jgi:hypothetical protein
MNKSSICKLINLLFLFSISSIFAGGVIKIIETDPNSDEKFESIMYVQDGKIRIEDKEDGGYITIFDTNKGILTNINLEDNTYFVLTKDDFKKFGQSIAKMRKQQEEMLNKLPEEQRESMKKMMDEQFDKMKKAPKKEFKQTKSGSFSKYDCLIYEGFSDGQKTDEIWVAEWGQMKLRLDYVRVFQGLKNFMQEMINNMGEYGELAQSDLDSWVLEKGFPVKSIDYENGQPIRISTIQEVGEIDLSEELFSVPAGYEQSNPFEGLE